MRRKIVAGNWKLHGDRKFACELLDAHRRGRRAGGRRAHHPAAAALPGRAGRALSATQGLQFGAQDVSANEKGAYTGEVSAAMLVDVGARYGLVGHSERRQYHGEEQRAGRAQVPRRQGGRPDADPVRRRNPERARGRPDRMAHRGAAGAGARAGRRPRRSTARSSPTSRSGRSAPAGPPRRSRRRRSTPSSVAKSLRCDARIAGSLPILYGGSVKPDNAAALFSQPDVDGGLIGGASLVAADFHRHRRCGGT